MTTRTYVRAAGVFAFMAFLSAQAATGFMRELFAGSVYPRAMRALDVFIETVFTGPFGEVGGALALLFLGALFAGLVLRRQIKSLG